MREWVLFLNFEPPGRSRRLGGEDDVLASTMQPVSQTETEEAEPAEPAGVAEGHKSVEQADRQEIAQSHKTIDPEALAEFTTDTTHDDSNHGEEPTETANDSYDDQDCGLPPEVFVCFHGLSPWLTERVQIRFNTDGRLVKIRLFGMMIPLCDTGAVSMGLLAQGANSSD